MSMDLPPAPNGGMFGATSSADRVLVQTDQGAKDGLAKCARCGATEISLFVSTGLLRCEFCRYEWQAQSAADAFDINGEIGLLVGTTVGSGANDITPSTDEVMTFKCGACGAEVVIDTNHSTQARCHWCRNKLSMNQQVANGAVPDMLLPFKLTKATAVEMITDFVGSRKFFAHPKFRAEFNAENVMGVYLPYMVVDINARAQFIGQGEVETREYTVKRGEDEVTRYDADVYNITREADLLINDLTVESSHARLAVGGKINTNNIINTIMPFDVENSVRYDSNYLAGFTSERRDANIEDVAPIVEVQVRDIARSKMRRTVEKYDRGVRWDHERVDIKGERWVSAYFPVWLYSFQQVKPNGKTFLHYVAVNARTGESTGSVPLNMPKLVAVSAVIQVISMAIGVGMILLGL